MQILSVEVETSLVDRSLQGKGAEKPGRKNFFP